jgi:short subunit dehydrogenase-like uncharacterized protein
MQVKTDFMIYGAYGYTGNLIARLAVERGLHPILAGRNPEKLQKQSRELYLDSCSFSLDDRSALEAALGRVKAVIHCAGPFIDTAQPMLDACLHTGVHYLDITGEFQVFEAIAKLDRQAKEYGITLAPGMGFDVVPSDCLAAHLKARLPSATYLALGILSLGKFSHGTAITTVKNLGQAGMIRQGGELSHIPPGSKKRMIDFGRGAIQTIAMTWGDVSTAFYSTGIPNIEVYRPAPSSIRRLLWVLRYLQPILVSPTVQKLLISAIRRGPPGPTETERKSGLSILWGEVVDNVGNRAAARLQTPEGYSLTAQTALEATLRCAAGKVASGYQTPSMAFGADFITEFEGIIRQDLI